MTVILIFLHVIVAACSDSRPSTDVEIREWFKWSTGLELAKGTKILNGKITTVATIPPLGLGLDTYYIKMKVLPEFKKLLGRHFEKATWKSCEKSLAPPPEWHREMPFWKPFESKRKTCYEKMNYVGGNVDSGGFVSTILYDEDTGTVYFVGAQFAG